MGRTVCDHCEGLCVSGMYPSDGKCLDKMCSLKICSVFICHQKLLNEAPEMVTALACAFQTFEFIVSCCFICKQAEESIIF